MNNEEDTNSRRASLATHAPDHRPSAPVPATSNGSNGNGNGAEHHSFSIATLLVPDAAAKLAALPRLAKNIHLEDLFVTQAWHRPYAEALLNANPANLPALVAEAERAIFDRYLELSTAPVQTDEFVDLGHAIDTLSQIKKATAPTV